MKGFIEIKEDLRGESENVPLEELFNKTLGVPRNIRAFFKVTKDENANEFYQKALSQKTDFNDFTANYLINKLSTRLAGENHGLSMGNAQEKGPSQWNRRGEFWAWRPPAGNRAILRLPAGG